MAELIDDSLIAGARAENEDVADDAAINPLKIAVRAHHLKIDVGHFFAVAQDL